MSLTIEKRLEKLELSQVYLPENLKDIEQRLIQVESDNRKHEEERAKERLKNVEDAIKEIPSNLIENWSEVITKVQKMHHEDKERKEAVQAIWKRLDEVKLEVCKLQDNIETASHGDDMENMKVDMGEVQSQLRGIDNRMSRDKPWEE